MLTIWYDAWRSKQMGERSKLAPSVAKSWNLLNIPSSVIFTDDVTAAIKQLMAL